MNPRHALVLAFWLTVLPVHFALLGTPAHGQDNPAPVTTVTEVNGSVMTRPTDQDPWARVNPGDRLPTGSMIRTGIRGAVTLEVGPNATVTVQRLTELTVGQLEIDEQTNTVRTLIGLDHGKIDFDVKHVGFENDFRIASPTDVVAVKGTVGTCEAAGGWMDITGHRSNGVDAIHKRHVPTNKTASLSREQMIRGGDRGPMDTFKRMIDTDRAMGGMADLSTRMPHRGDETKPGNVMDSMTDGQQSMRGMVTDRQDRERWFRERVEQERRRNHLEDIIINE